MTCDNPQRKRSRGIEGGKRTWVGGTRITGVGTVPLDSGQKLALLDPDLLLDLAVEHVKHLAANDGSNKPAHARKRDDHDSKCNVWLKGDEGDQWLGNARRQQQRTAHTSNQARRDGEENLDAAAAQTQLEEGVPVKRGLDPDVGASRRGLDLGLLAQGRGRLVVCSVGRLLGRASETRGGAAEDAGRGRQDLLLLSAAERELGDAEGSRGTAAGGGREGCLGTALSEADGAGGGPSQDDRFQRGAHDEGCFPIIFTDGSSGRPLSAEGDSGLETGEVAFE